MKPTSRRLEGMRSDESWRYSLWRETSEIGLDSASHAVSPRQRRSKRCYLIVDVDLEIPEVLKAFRSEDDLVKEGA